MMIYDLPNQTESTLLVVPDERTDTVNNLNGTDISQYEGNMAVDAMFEAIGTGTTKTVTITVQHNNVQSGADGGWANIPADALVDPATGDPDTFGVVGAAAYTDRLGLVKERLKKYIRIVLTCGSADVVHLGAVLLTAQKKYS